MKSDRMQIGPPGTYGQLLTVTVDKTIVTICEDGTEYKIRVPTLTWSDINALVVRLVAELNAENDRSVKHEQTNTD